MDDVVNGNKLSKHESTYLVLSFNDRYLDRDDCKYPEFLCLLIIIFARFDEIIFAVPQ